MPLVSSVGNLSTLQICGYRFGKGVSWAGAGPAVKGRQRATGIARAVGALLDFMIRRFTINAEAVSLTPKKHQRTAFTRIGTSFMVAALLS